MDGNAQGWPAWESTSGVPGALWDSLGEHVSEALAAGRRAIAAFDADGTLWAGDVGERHLRLAESEGQLTPPPGHPSVFSAYRTACEQDTTEGYAWAVSAFAGLAERDVRASAARTWDAHRSMALAPVWRIVRALQTAGAEIWVVSASNRWVIEAAAPELGIPPERVIAMTAPIVAGVVSSEVLRPRPNGPGKVACLLEAAGQAPLLAFGNSVHDGAMLDSAALGVLVHASTSDDPRPGSDLVSLAEASGWARLSAPARSPDHRTAPRSS